MPGRDTKNCDILILSSDFGMGHNQVSRSIEINIKQKMPFWKVKAYNFFGCVHPILGKIIKFGYSQMVNHFPSAYNQFYRATKDIDSISKWQQILNYFGSNKLLNIIVQCSPRVIICTFPTPAGVVSQLKLNGKIDIPLVVIVTDVAVHSQWIHPMVDAYIVAADVVLRGLIKRGIPKNKIFVTGIPLRPQFESPPHSVNIWGKYGTVPSLFTLLIMGGGQGLMPGIGKIIRGLEKLSLPMQIVILSGKNKALSSRLKRITKGSSIAIRILEYEENIAPIMQNSHLLLSKAGGITVFESLALGLPILLYKPLPGHEMCNVEFLLDNKAALIAYGEDEAIEQIRKAIADPSILKNISNAMIPLSKPSATDKAVDVILDLALGDMGIDKGEPNKDL